MADTTKFVPENTFKRLDCVFEEKKQKQEAADVILKNAAELELTCERLQHTVVNSGSYAHSLDVDQLNNRREELKNDLKLCQEELKALTLECEVCLSDVKKEITHINHLYQVELKNNQHLNTQVEDLLYRQKQMEHEQVVLLKETRQKLRAKTQEVKSLKQQNDSLNDQCSHVQEMLESREKDLLDLKTSFQRKIEEETCKNYDAEENIRKFESEVKSKLSHMEVLSNENQRLKSLLKAAKRKLESTENQKDGSLYTSPVKSNITAVDELTQQLISLQAEVESTKKAQQHYGHYESQNNLMQMEIEQLKNDLQKVEKEKTKLSRKQQDYKKFIQDNCVEKLEAEAMVYQAQMNAQIEVNQFFQKMNAFLESQTARQDYIDSLRYEDSEKLKHDIQEFYKDMKSELVSIRSQHYRKLTENETSDIVIKHLHDTIRLQTNVSKRLAASGTTTA